MKNIKKFTIDRKRWLRGVGTDNSYLYRSIDKKMCCLGFYGRALGCRVNDIKDKESPSEVPKLFPEWLTDSTTETDWNNVNVVFESNACQRLVSINDDEYLSDEEREKLIKQKFAEQGVEVEFRGEYE